MTDRLQLHPASEYARWFDQLTSASVELQRVASLAKSPEDRLFMQAWLEQVDHDARRCVEHAKIVLGPVISAMERELAAKKKKRKGR